MAQNSKIEWTDHTANLWWGCTEVHAGCDNCYARVLSNRWGEKLWGNDVPRRAIKSVWKDLDRYQREAKKMNRIDRVFVGSMMDIFEKPMPYADGFTTNLLRTALFDGITMGRFNNLMFLLLTKRPSNINKYIPESWKESPPENVMFGTSPVDQKTADLLIPQLLKVNGMKFLSVEPQLGKINLLKLNKGHHLEINALTGTTIYSTYEGVGAVGRGNKIDWVIQGGESGHHRRPFDLDWAKSMREQCSIAGVPYFFKQIDKVQPIPDELMIREFPLIPIGSHNL